jgi:hypothetical protein
MNRSQQILFLCIIFGIGVIALLTGVVMYLHAGAPTMTSPAERILGSVSEPPISGENTLIGISGDGFFLSTVDASTGKPLGGVSVYFDGGYAGSTSAQGRLGIPNSSMIPEGLHTLRISKTGYRDYTERIAVPFPSQITITLQEQLLVPVQEHGAHPAKIDIVFVPSGTSYNCAEQKKITTSRYVTDKTAFVTDVDRIVKESLFTLDSITDNTNPIPADYRDQFNIYYYYDTSQFADAFNGCAGTVPENVWKTAPFADIVIILYPTYYPPYTGDPCEPNGCVNPGTGRSWMKIPADKKILFMHESGHAIFGLIDTYCGNTDYRMNGPYPNVWSSQESCVSDAFSNARDASACQQIQQKNPSDCTKQFWRWDPDPDIMREGYSGRFGKASTSRITYIFNTTNAWGKTA